jgi:predicted transposase/invertase (TIGR01784 family)
MKERNLITFDWAMKRLLRQKANFEVLEGFLSELVFRKIVIKNISESEGNKTDKDDKSNKVDIMVEVDGREMVIIELQYDSIADYFHRMLFGVSKAITDYMHAGDAYSNVRKVYSISIVYFDLGGDDYIYHGFTNFTGLHSHTELQLTAIQQQLYNKKVPGDIYPEYYLIAVNGFDDIARNTLDEWVYYLKNNRIEDNFTPKGLSKAKHLLLVYNLSQAEKEDYYRSIDNKLVSDSAINTALLEGEAIGLEKGKIEGEAIGLEKVIINGFLAGQTVNSMAIFTGLTPEQITAILKRKGLI